MLKSAIFLTALATMEQPNLSHPVLYVAPQAFLANVSKQDDSKVGGESNPPNPNLAWAIKSNEDSKIDGNSMSSGSINGIEVDEHLLWGPQCWGIKKRLRPLGPMASSVCAQDTDHSAGSAVVAGTVMHWLAGATIERY